MIAFSLQIAKWADSTDSRASLDRPASPVGQHNKDVPRWRLLTGQKNTLFALQIERAPRMGKEDSPAFRTGYPEDWDTRSIGGEVGTYLPVPHSVRGASAIQRMTSLTEAEDGAAAKVEVDCRARPRLKLKLGDIV